MYAIHSLISRFNVFCNNIDLIYLKSLHTAHIFDICKTIDRTHTVIVKLSNIEIEDLPKQLLKQTEFAKIFHFAMFIRSGNLFIIKKIQYWITG